MNCTGSGRFCFIVVCCSAWLFVPARAVGQDGLIRDPEDAIPEAEQAAIDYVANMGPCHKNRAVVAVGESLVRFDKGGDFVANRLFAYDLLETEGKQRYFSLATETTFADSAKPRVAWFERYFRGGEMYWRNYLQGVGPQGQARYDLDKAENEGRKLPNLYPPFTAYAWTMGSQSLWGLQLLDERYLQTVLVTDSKLKSAKYEPDGDVTGTWLMRHGGAVWIVRFDRDSDMMPVSITMKGVSRKIDYSDLLEEPPRFKSSIEWAMESDGVLRPRRVSIVETNPGARVTQTAWKFRWLDREQYQLRLPDVDSDDWRIAFAGKCQDCLPQWVEVPEVAAEVKESQ